MNFGTVSVYLLYKNEAIWALKSELLIIMKPGTNFKFLIQNWINYPKSENRSSTNFEILIQILINPLSDNKVAVHQILYFNPKLD